MTSNHKSCSFHDETQKLQVPVVSARKFSPKYWWLTCTGWCQISIWHRYVISKISSQTSLSSVQSATRGMSAWRHCISCPHCCSQSHIHPTFLAFYQPVTCREDSGKSTKYCQSLQGDEAWQILGQNTWNLGWHTSSQAARERGNTLSCDPHLQVNLPTGKRGKAYCRHSCMMTWVRTADIFLQLQKIRVIAQSFVSKAACPRPSWHYEAWLAIKHKEISHWFIAASHKRQQQLRQGQASFSQT